MSEYTIKLSKPHCDKCGRVKVKDSDGATRYVKKVTNKILSNVAIEVGDNLRSRLDNAIATTLEDDI